MRQFIANKNFVYLSTLVICKKLSCIVLRLPVRQITEGSAASSDGIFLSYCKQNQSITTMERN